MSVARERLREVADEASERTVEFLLGVLDAGLPLVLKPYSEWLDAVQAHVDTYRADYPQPEEVTLQRVLEIIDGSCWVNNASYKLSTFVYGYTQAREACIKADPLDERVRMALAGTVLEALDTLYGDTEEDE